MLYVVTLVTSGLALIANAGALALRASPRTSLLVLRRLASVVGLSLALLFSLTAPWRGPLTVSGQPIDAIVRDLQTGFFDAASSNPDSTTFGRSARTRPWNRLASPRLRLTRRRHGNEPGELPRAARPHEMLPADHPELM